MAINFPDPNSVQTYTFGNKTWEWNGRAWVVVSANLSTVSRYVSAINGSTGEVGLSAGSGIEITKSGVTFIVTNTGSLITDYVSFFNGVTGSVGISGGNNVTIDVVGKTFIINSTSSGGIVGDYVKFINGLTSGITFFAGTGMSLNFSAAGITFLTTTVTDANTFTQIQNFNQGISAAGATFMGSIVLQNSEFIRNSLDGSIDFMPSGSASNQYGIRFDHTGLATGVRLYLVRASDGSTGVTQNNNFYFMRPVYLNNNIDLTLGSFGWSKLRHFTQLPDGTTGLASLNIGVLNSSSQSTSGAVAIMNSSHFDTVGRIIGTQHTNPNLYVFSNDNGQTLDFIRFEHDQTDGNIVVGQGNLNLSAALVNIPNLNIVDGGSY